MITHTARHAPERSVSKGLGFGLLLAAGFLVASAGSFMAVSALVAERSQDVSPPSLFTGPDFFDKDALNRSVFVAVSVFTSIVVFSVVGALAYKRRYEAAAALVRFFAALLMLVALLAVWLALPGTRYAFDGGQLVIIAVTSFLLAFLGLGLGSRFSRARWYV